MYLKVRVTKRQEERERESERASNYWSNPQIAATTWIEPGKSQEPFSGLPYR